MPVETIDGVDFIGTLHIPRLGITLPIAADYNYDQLAQTPVRYNGSYYTNDLVVCAHNYASHFEPLKDLDMGEEIILKSVTGRIYHYRVTNRQTIEPTEVDQVYKDTSSDKDWDLSLFTCTPSGLARVLVRCSFVGNS
ncbi:sortase [Streptococcus sp. E17BB]|uniref:sortase n=1 Tax=Streptococcus sp. E17BB TaxID=3278714 RepID=UPI00359E774F